MKNQGSRGSGKQRGAAERFVDPLFALSPAGRAASPGAFRYRYVILAVLTFCYTVQYVDRVQINTLMPFISKSLQLSAVQIGLGSTLMMLFYGPSQWFTGWLCDRFGSRRILLFSVLAWSALTGWMAGMQGVTEWYVRMALFGILIGTEFIPSARLLVRWFPPRQRATSQSVLSWAWIITPAWSPLMATALYVALGNNWRLVFVILALAGIVPFLLILAFIVDRPERCGRVHAQELHEAYTEERERGLITAEDLSSGNPERIEQNAKAGNIRFGTILRTRGYLPVVLVIVAAQQVFWGVLVWSAKYLAEVHNFAVLKMGAWACVYFAGAAVGSLLSSRISDTVLGGRRRPMILVCFGGSIPFILLLANIHQGVSPYVLLLALTGAGFFANMVWGPALSMPADMFPAEVYGKAMGFTNCIGYMLASACPYIMGALIVRDPATGSVDYHRAWLYVAFAAFAGVVAALFLVDRKRSEGGAAVSKPVLDSLTAQPNP